MSIDNSTLLRQTATDIIRGLRKERGAFADIVCTKKVRDSIKGSEPYRASTDTLARDVAGQAIGTDPLPINFNMSSIDWDMERYHRSTAFDASELTDLGQYFEPIGEYAETLVDHIDTGIDVDLTALLENASFNNSVAAANGNWSAPTSTPVEDLQKAAREEVPGLDMAIFGFQTAQELCRHPDMKEFNSNYAGGGALPMGALQSVLAEILMIEPSNVHIMANFYNSANAGQTLSIAYASGTELAWVGHKRGLVMVEQPYPSAVEGDRRNQGIVTVEQTHLKYEMAYARTLDLKRVDTQLGCYFTGI